MYGLAEHSLVAWGSGHLSWVSRVSFDPWLWQRAGAGSRAQLRTLSGNARSNQERVYRLGSVGMDCQLFLWDVIILQDSALSSLSLGIPTQPSSVPEEGPQRSANVTARTSRLGSSDAMHKTAAMQAVSLGLPLEISPAASHLDMVFMPPVTQHKIHMEPLTDVLFTRLAIFTACYGGSLKAWQRPGPHLTA